VSVARAWTGQVALITGCGSSSGIGFACARHLGAIGARLVLTSTTGRVKQRAAELQDLGMSAIGYVADLTDPGQATDLVAAATHQDPQAGVVNNAGMTTVTSPEV